MLPMYDGSDHVPPPSSQSSKMAMRDRDLTKYRLVDMYQLDAFGSHPDSACKWKPFKPLSIVLSPVFQGERFIIIGEAERRVLPCD